MGVAPPVYVFMGVIITVVPVVCEYVYNRTLATSIIILVLTTIVQFAVSDFVSVGVGILSLVILIILQNMFISFNRAGKIGIGLPKKREERISQSYDDIDEDIGENETFSQFEQIVKKSQQTAEILAEILESDAAADKRLHQIASLMAEVNEEFSSGSSAF